MEKYNIYVLKKQKLRKQVALFESPIGSYFASATIMKDHIRTPFWEVKGPQQTVFRKVDKQFESKKILRSVTAIAE